MILLYRVLKPVAQKLGPIQALILKDEGFKMSCIRQRPLILKISGSATGLLKMDQAKKLQEKYKLTLSENPWLTLDSASQEGPLKVFFKLERLSLGSEFGLGSKP